MLDQIKDNLDNISQEFALFLEQLNQDVARAVPIGLSVLIFIYLLLKKKLSGKKTSAK